MTAIGTYYQRNGWKRATATILALIIMLDVVWDGKSGSSCSPDVAGYTTSTTK